MSAAVEVTNIRLSPLSRHNLFFVPSPSAAALPAPLAPRSFGVDTFAVTRSLLAHCAQLPPAPPFPSSPLLRPAAQRDASCLLSASDSASSFFALQIETRSYMEL